MPKFEIVIYNKEVRKALDRMQPNDTGLEDKWAENNYIVIQTRTRDDAKREVARRYPEERGFVIEWHDED